MKSWIFAIAIGLMQLVCAGQAAALNDDEHQITQVMNKQFDKPEARLTVLPIVVQGNAAVAGWLQGGRGGRAFLQKDRNQWAIAVCGGSGLTQPEVLQSIGMKPDAAARLAAAVVAAEGQLGADKRSLFDGFNGMVKVDPHQGHGAHAPPSGHAEAVHK